MIQSRYKEFLARMAHDAGLKEEEIDVRVKQKQATLGGLVTLEGAALIVANELGIKFDMQKVKISGLMAGMRNVGLKGKIIKTYPIRTYKQRNGLEGKIGSFLMADETASVRVVLWDTNHIELVEEGRINEGSVLHIKKADVRGTDIKELHLGSKSSIEKINEEMPHVKVSMALSSSRVADLKDGDRVAVRGTIVQAFPIKFFPSCPECRKRLAESEGKFYCTNHQEVTPKYMPIFSFYIDDGTGNIRAVCFSEAVQKLFSLTEEAVLDLKDSPKEQEVRNSMLGQEFSFEGRGRKNALFNRLEFVVDSATPIDFDSIIEELRKEVANV